MTSEDANGVSQLEAGRLLQVIQAAVAQGLVTKAQVYKAVNLKPGKPAPELPEFTFPDSGYTVRVRRLGPFTLDRLRITLSQEVAPPTPPRVRAYYGEKENPEADDPGWTWEENPADPEYKKALEEWQAGQNESLGMRVIDTIIEHAVIADVDVDEVKAVRQMLIGMGVAEDDLKDLSDHQAYIKHICISSTGDLSALQAFVLGESIPTEARIQQHEAVFQREVSESTHIPVQSTDLGSPVQRVA